MAAGASVPPPEGPSVEGASLFPAEAAGLASLPLTPRPSAAFRTRSFGVFVLCVFPCVCWLCRTACGILVPNQGLNLVSLWWELSPHCWSTRGVPQVRVERAPAPG